MTLGLGAQDLNHTQYALVMAYWYYMYVTMVTASNVTKTILRSSRASIVKLCSETTLVTIPSTLDAICAFGAVRARWKSLYYYSIKRNNLPYLLFPTCEVLVG